jgi:hypothetical protein
MRRKAAHEIRKERQNAANARPCEPRSSPCGTICARSPHREEASMSALYRSCPQCGDEFQHWVSECPDCRVPLRELDPNAPRPPAVEPPPRAEPALDLGDFVCIRVADVWQLRTLAERLEAAGVACRVDAFPPGASLQPSRAGARTAPRGTGTQLGLYVRRDDVAHAREVEHAERVETTPDLPASAAASGADFEGCPGCGTPIDPAREECAECGLVFPPLEIHCARCGAPVEPDAAGCARCGFSG